ncbi:MAG: small multi-drug export protein [Nanoarchaeota archaeon]|nr:small multi-drug export protein [Nanoarchaeota archaeon]
MIKEIIELIAITFLPILELRASIPYGILKLHMDWILVFLICVLANIVVGMLVFFLLDKFIHLVIKIKPVGKLYHKFVERTQKKIHAAIEKWGELGVAVFIGIPVPGSGVYTGALGAYLLGMDYKQFFIACFWGVLLAGVIVTAIVLSGATAWNFFIKLM